jgi:hypothetical protein
VRAIACIQHETLFEDAGLLTICNALQTYAEYKGRQQEKSQHPTREWYLVQ